MPVLFQTSFVLPTYRSWTEDTRAFIFSESALRRGQESHGSMVDIMDQQIEQKFQDFDLLAAEGKKLLNEDHPLAKMVNLYL